MRTARTLLGFLLAGGLLPAQAAPLFPDVPEAHWAHDAISTLAAKGLLEGYPDGTFKGDRAATRWEVAMVIARLLAAFEQNSAKFATRADLQSLRNLAEAYRPELEALGVRITNLEEQTSRLDRRVTELERITFYGSSDTRVVAESFTNDGQPDNNDKRSKTGALGSGIPYLNYNSAVGANPGSTFRPQGQGVIPVVDYTFGRSLSNGVGLTSKLVLGVRAQITDDVTAVAEFAGYTSQGNNVINSYWGVQAPYLLNPSTANVGAGQSNTPYTSMVLDHLTLTQDSSHTKLVLGAFNDLHMDSFVYVGQPNLSVDGPGRIPGFGFDLQGEVNWGSDSTKLLYEAMGTRFGEANVYDGSNYTHVVFGGDLNLKFNHGNFKLNFARYYDDDAVGGEPQIGLVSTTNVPYGAATGYTPTQWVNPPGYYAAQLSATQQSQTGQVANKLFVPNTGDTRPIPGWSSTTDNAVGLGAGAGNYGPQAQTTYGASAHYSIPLGEDERANNVRFGAEYGHSDYQSNKDSSYSRSGDLARIELASDLLDGNLRLKVDGLRVTATYNPAVFANDVNGLRLVTAWNFTGRFALFDNAAYPYNRTGIRTEGSFKAVEALTFNWKANFLQQTQTSLYDVRVPENGIGAGTPNVPVLGFAPGWFDPVFSGFASPLQYGKNSGNAFDANLNPLENPRGHEFNLGLGLHYVFDHPRLEVEAGWTRSDYSRSSILSVAQGGSQDYVNMGVDDIVLHLNWKVSPRLTLKTGLDLVHAKGHFDPAGIYNGYAAATDSTSFGNIASLQTVPSFGIESRLAPDLTCSANFRYYITRDQIGSAVYAGAGSAYIGYSANPFSWSGPQVITEVKYNF